MRHGGGRGYVFGGVGVGGVPFEYLRERVAGLAIRDEFQLRQEKVLKNGQLATKIHVEVSPIKTILIVT